MLKPGLELKLGQQLTMTPQLRQAIRLLQLSTVELQQEIHEALETNPLLELDVPEGETQTSAEADASQLSTDAALQQDTFKDDLPVDTNWDDMWSPGTGASLSTSTADDQPIYQGETHQSLQDYLRWQLELSHFSPIDEQIGLTIIDGITDSGYLEQETADLLATIRQVEPEVTEAELETVLKRIQHFDPTGVAARSVPECLVIQLRHLPADTPARAAAERIVSDHMPLLARHDYRTLARRTRLSDTDLKAAMQLIQTLQPRPGELFSPAANDYVVPDLLVRRHEERWQVELNPDTLPRLRLNEDYAKLASDTANPQASQYIRQHSQEAQWLMKSIASRNETLLKVATCIVHWQQAFFNEGEQAMKPLTLAHVAREIDMHESTVSRVTTQKYMHTPRGIFELKYFFSSQVGHSGEESSATAIQAHIKRLVAAENPAKPLSDSKLVKLIGEEGIKVARRTVAKYREALHIPPSSQRKRLL